MNNLPTDEELIDFLYGNMPAEKQKVIREYLEENPEKKVELEGLSDTRDLLGKYEEHEVIAPELKAPENKLTKSFFSPILKSVMAVAASISLLMLIGFFTDFNIQYANGELSVRFGEEARVDQVDNVKLERIEQMLAELQKQKPNERIVEAKLDKYLEEKEEFYQEKFEISMKQFAKNERETIKNYLQQVRNENTKTMDEYFLSVNTNQQQYIEDVLIDFTKYMDEQRLQDRQFYVDHLVDIKYNSELEQQETEQMLSALINRVNIITNENETQKF